MMTVTLHVLTARLIIATDDFCARLSSRGARGAGRRAGEGHTRLAKNSRIMCNACRTISSAGCARPAPARFGRASIAPAQRDCDIQPSSEHVSVKHHMRARDIHAMLTVPLACKKEMRKRARMA